MLPNQRRREFHCYGMTMECTCEHPGFCERFKKQMAPRMYAICQGAVLTPEKCEAYRKYWLNNKHETPDNTCQHRGTELRKELCQLCGDRQRLEPIYQCELHGECSLKRFKYGTKFQPKACSLCNDRKPVNSDPKVVI